MASDRRLSWHSPTWLRIASVVWGVLGGALCATLGRREICLASDLYEVRPWPEAFFAPQVALAAVTSGAYCMGLLLFILRRAHRPSVVVWAFPVVSAVPLLAFVAFGQGWRVLSDAGLVRAPGWEDLNPLFETAGGMVSAVGLGIISGLVFYALLKLTARLRQSGEVRNEGVERRRAVRVSRTRWVVANILGVAIGYGAGYVAAEGLGRLADTLYRPQMASGIPVGSPFVLLLVLGTLGGAVAAAAGYAVRQRLSWRQFAARSAARYALVGAACWPVLAALHLAGAFYLTVPLSVSLFPAGLTAPADGLLFTLAFVSPAILMSLPVGLAIAILTRKEVG